MFAPECRSTFRAVIVGSSSHSASARKAWAVLM